MNEEFDLPTRVAALEQAVAKLHGAVVQPMIGLIDWCSKDVLNDLGHARGKARALEAFAVAVVATTPDREALVRALSAEIARANDAFVGLPSDALVSARAAFAATIVELQRALGVTLPAGMTGEKK